MQKTINGIPVFTAEISDNECGMEIISLVDSPAVESLFLAFDAKKKMPLYFIENEERRLILGVVARANYPIYRNDFFNGEYYIVFTPEMIRAMAQKYMAENRANLVNLMHEPGSEVKGVEMVQFFIKGKGVSPEGFDDIADGSLFCEFHVENDEVWALIKEGTFKGFSLEGLFGLNPMETNKNDSKMTKVQKLKEQLAKLLIGFSTATTDKGVIEWDSDEDLKQGDMVYIPNEEGGERQPAPDGDYKTEDGKIIKVQDGKVEEIVDPDAEVSEEENAAEEVPNPDGSEEPAPDAVEELRKEVNELYELVDRILKAMGSSREEIQRMRSQIAELEKRPAAPSVQEEFQGEETKPATGNSEALDRAIAIASARR